MLYRKFPICFALPFLANLCNNLSYVLYRKFPIYFASVFLAILNHIFVLLYTGNILYNILDKMLLKLSEKTCGKTQIIVLQTAPHRIS